MTAPSQHRGPRIVFVTTGSTESAADGIAWRLDAANNRPLGRSVCTQPSLADCRSWLDALRVDIARGTVFDAVSFDAVRGLWTWRLRRDGVVCAISVRTYLRRFECRRAVAHFRATLGETSSDAGVVRLVRADVLQRYKLGALPDESAVAPGQAAANR